MILQSYTATTKAFGRDIEVEYHRGRLTLDELSPEEARRIIDALEGGTAGGVLALVPAP